MHREIVESRPLDLKFSEQCLATYLKTDPSLEYHSYQPDHNGQAYHLVYRRNQDIIFSGQPMNIWAGIKRDLNGQKKLIFMTGWNELSNDKVRHKKVNAILEDLKDKITRKCF